MDQDAFVDAICYRRYDLRHTLCTSQPPREVAGLLFSAILTKRTLDGAHSLRSPSNPISSLLLP